jgi:hypothetical protein
MHTPLSLEAGWGSACIVQKQGTKQQQARIARLHMAVMHVVANHDVQLISLPRYDSIVSGFCCVWACSTVVVMSQGAIGDGASQQWLVPHL